MPKDTDIEELRRLYVDEELGTHQIADRVGMSPASVWHALSNAGVEMRQRGVRPRLDEADLRRWYLEEGLSSVQIADRTGMSTSGVVSALDRAGIDRRPLAAATLPIDDPTLERLYVTERIDLDDLAARYDVPPWAVRRRLREAGIARPAGPPGRDRSTPPRKELVRLYVDEGATLAELGAHYEVPARTVRLWLEIYEIELRPRPASAGQRPDAPLALTRGELREQYVERGLTAAEIADNLGVTKNIVTAALHAQRLPVRPSGPSRRPPIILLDALYADLDVGAALDRHGIDRRPQAGWLRERWPVPVELSENALRELYVDIGLSAQHISLLTGHRPEAIRLRLQRAGVRARGGSRSPWRAATRKAR